MIVKIIICIIIPLLLFSLILDKHARLIVLFLCLGTISCFFAYLLNSYILANTSCTSFYLTTTIAPIIEEFLKFTPIFIASKFSKTKNVLFPIAFAIGIGFAITENMYMLVEYADSANIEWLILRGISTGLMHAMSSSIIALGILKSGHYPKAAHVGIVASMFLAMMYHGFYNCLVNNNTIMRYIGIIMPIITYSIIFIIYKKDAILALLGENK